MKNFITILAAAAVMTACSNQQEKQTSNNRGEQSVIEGQVVVKMNAGTDEKDINRVLGKFEKREVLDKNMNIYIVSDKKLNGNEVGIAGELSNDSAVEFAEPNFRKTLQQEIPQDPYFMKLWGLRNFGQDAPNGIEGVEGADIDTARAWAKTKGSKNVKVAVLDTGCWYKHPDLAENIWVNQKEKDGVPGVDDDGNGYYDDIHGWDSISDNRGRIYFNQVGDPDPEDDHGHGTHVAGTIGAMGGNGIGIVGVNWNVSIACVKFLDANGSGSSVDEFRALQYVLANDFDIVSGSYGGGAESKLELTILKEGQKKGVLFVFAAGNEATDIDQTKSFPASYDVESIIAVAATDSRDQIADFSNFGQKTVHIAAPGVNIMSTVPPAVNGEDNPPYAVWSGTSMATPHVSGAAALLLAAEPGLKKQPIRVKERLMSTADFKPQLASMVASGRLNIARAINNETSGNPTRGGRWEEIPYPVETPRYPQKKVDHAWEIKVPGAKALQVHIGLYQVEPSFDAAVLYDGNYKQAMILSGEAGDVWSPIILGDTAYLKFSNSMVSINNGEAFANFNSLGVQIDKVKVLK